MKEPPMETQLRALIVEDSPSDTLLLLRELRRAGYAVEHVRVDTAEDMTAALKNTTWDVILSDFSMPNFSATAALELVQASGIDLPFIIVSGTMGEEAAVTAMKAGAHDYFPKGRTTRLASAIAREIEDARERQQRQKAEFELRQAEERFTKAFQVSPIGITISTSTGVFVAVNDAFRRLVGTTMGEIVGLTGVELDMWHDLTDQHLLQSSSKGYEAIQGAEIILNTRSREIRYVSVSTGNIELGGERCVLAMWHDITQRKQAEQALKRHSQLTELLREVTTAANEASEVAPIFYFVIDRICRFAGWEMGQAYVQTRGDAQPLTSLIWYTNQPDKFKGFEDTANRRQLTETTGGLAYQVFASGIPEWIVGGDHNFTSNLPGTRVEDSIHSIYAFPIFVQHKVSAVIEFFSTTPLVPNEPLLEMMPHIATQVGYVIERIWAKEEITALYNATAYLFNADSLHDLGRQIVEGVVHEFKHVDCGLLLLNKHTGQLNRLARAGQGRVNVDAPLTIDGPGLIPKAMRDGRMIYAPDVQEEASYISNVPATRSEIVVPLRSRGVIIGALDLQSSQRNYFTEADQRVLSAFAERAAAAIEIIRLYEDINQHAAQLELRVAERTQELQAAKEHVETILHNSSDAITLVKNDGSIQQVNPRFSELLGYDSDELFGKNLTHIILPEDSETVLQMLKDFRGHGQYRRLEVLAHRKDQTVFPMDAAFAAFTHKHEIAIICSLRDISAQKHLEQELRSAFEQQRALSELKSQFVSTVSHEYRTPLAIIQSSITMLIRYDNQLSEERKKQHLEKIQFQVNRLTDLLNDILEIDRAEAMGMEFNPEPLDILSLCQEIVTDMQQVYPEHPIQLHTLGEISSIVADPKLLHQIISNLLSNAMKYSPEQSIIRLSLMFTQENFTLTVEDKGIGIPEEALDDLFTIFHRAKNVGQIQGTGLGLAIVKKAVEAHKGTISVESKVGQGTTFSVHISKLR